MDKSTKIFSAIGVVGFVHAVLYTKQIDDIVMLSNYVTTLLVVLFGCVALGCTSVFIRQEDFESKIDMAREAVVISSCFFAVPYLLIIGVACLSNQIVPFLVDLALKLR